MAKRVKNPLVMWEIQVQSLGWEDPLEKGMVTHFSILAWRINPMDRGAWRAAAHGVSNRLSTAQYSTYSQLIFDKRGKTIQ